MPRLRAFSVSRASRAPGAAGRAHPEGGSVARVLKAVDLFCGAGGTSSGLLGACARLGLEVDLLAINHWKVAVATHTLNHPGVRHLCEDLATVDPRRAVP